MPQVNLSALNGQELRQLLDSSRRRGDAALSYKVLQEMAARRDNPSARRGFSRTATDEPLLVDMDLGDPAEDDDLPPMPNWRPPAHEPEDMAPPPAPEEAAAPHAPILAEDVEPAPRVWDADRPLSLRDADPEPAGDELPPLRAETPRRGSATAAAKPRPAYRPRLRLVVGFAIGIAVGTALGFWVGEMPRDAPSPAAPAVAPVQTAALAPAPAPAAEPAAPIPAEQTPDAQSDATAAPASPPNAQQGAGDVNTHASDMPPPPPPPVTEPTRSAEIAQPAAERPAAAAVAAGCATASTPADRAICGDPNLRRLQGELRRAYNEALDAHQDRALLREHQLAWRDARNPVSDPTRLAQLYEERIRKLNAATAEALRER